MWRWFEHTQIYRPVRPWDADGGAVGSPWEDVYFASLDGVQLNGWYFPAVKAGDRSRVAVLICHGNSGNVSHRTELCAWLRRQGVASFVFDYRGYGRSEGKPTEEGTYLDAQAAHHWLQARGYAPEGIIAYGESLGGAIATEVAVRERVGGLILQSTFTNMPTLGKELFPWLPVTWLGSIHYDPIGKLPKLRVPVLIFHSRGDRLVRFEHSQRNYAAANEPKVFHEVSGHHLEALNLDQPGCEEKMNWLLDTVAEQVKGAAAKADFSQSSS